MASIVKRKNRYSVVYTYKDDDGNQHQKWETFDTNADAKKRKTQIEFEQQSGTFIIPNATTVADLLEEYCSVYGVNNWAMSTYRSKKGLMYNYIIPLIGDVKLDELTPRLMDPFKVTADISMVELKESIQKFGILNPLIVRPVIEGYYEIISGHRRRYAAKQLGYTKVPVIIKVMRTDEAIVAMVDSNLQREFITPSEKARAYKMKYDVLRKKKNVNCCGRVVHKTKGKRTVEILAEQYGESAKQIQRYLKLNDLIPDLLSKVDDDELSFSAAIEIAFLKEEEQQWFLEAMNFAQATPSLSQAQRIKRLSQEKKLTKDEIKDILAEIKREDVSRVTFKTEQLRRFFPKRCKTVRILKTPKTESSVRKVYIPRSVAMMLNEWRDNQNEIKGVLGEEYQDYGLVMATSYGLPASGSYLRKGLKKIIDEHNLPPVVFHSLRHTSVTYKLKLNGGDIKAVQGDSGHSQVNIITDVYSHIIDEDRRKNAELFEDAFYGKKNLDPSMSAHMP